MRHTRRLARRMMHFAREHAAAQGWSWSVLNWSLLAALVEAVTRIPDERYARRRASMFEDGTKVGLSYQRIAGAEAAPAGGEPLRALFEPGGVGVALAEQIDLSLTTLNRLIQLSGWRTVAASVDHVTRVVFPSEREALNDWWGGIWLGCEMRGESHDIRVYMNLRSGPLLTRWQRVADALAPFAPRTMAARFLQLVERAGAAGGIPVGLALVLVQDRLACVRLYVAIDRPDSASVARTVPAESAGSAARVARCLDDLQAHLGRFQEDAVTVAYDFALEDGVIASPCARFKVDVGCAAYRHGEPSARLDGWLASDWGREAWARLTVFRERMAAVFGGASFDYVSFGYFPDGREQRTAYFKPHGLATPTTAHDLPSRSRAARKSGGRRQLS